eukprot:gnl/MRDRNA2_/MRDRNA2_28793_c0_seq1.p1 gnl/MRDRNA2_/MRDRNA2_28793_c0~~gnl/MRDRNA2_/MRDRNA2_28793_c0_seq1.p1  ORF type:complete len:559 (+),score=96.89 gnl/MRDRNA2_/MRDRNA2_28793_c0_seq1:67-1743(+)
MASHWRKQAFGTRKCRISRSVPSFRQGGKITPLRSAKSQPTSLLPVNQAAGAVSGSTKASQHAQENAILHLPLGDLDSKAFVLPAIDDALVRTPPPWNAPCVPDFESPKVNFSLPKTVLESKCSHDSPIKTPGRVAKVFAELLPTTPKRTLEKSTTNTRRRDSGIVSCGLKVISKVGTALGLKTRKHHFRSLAELRRHLIQRHQTLNQAFREIAKHSKKPTHNNDDGSDGAWTNSQIESELCARMQAKDFVNAMSFFAIDSAESLHFFNLIKKNGDDGISLEELKDALVNLPADLMLQGFRQRLLARCASTYVNHEVFRELFSVQGSKFVEQDQSQSLGRRGFERRLLHLGFEEQDASLLFNIFDADAAGSVSVEQLQEKLRGVAPSVSLEEFWHRFNARWPNIRGAASSGPEGRRRATASLFQILPVACRGSAPRGVSLDMPMSLSLDAWDLLCAQLDVSPSNGEELFRQCASAKAWQGHQTLHSGQPAPKQMALRLPLFANYLEGCCDECDLEDFFDELLLWSQTPLASQGPGMCQSYGRDVAQRFRMRQTQVMAA